MGYRHYFFKVSKKDIEHINKLTYEQLEDINDKNNFRLGLYEKEVFEFGKLYYEDTDERIYKKGTPLFKDKKIQKEFDDYCPYIVGKEGLLEAIAIYKEKIISFYSDCFKDGAIQILPFGIEVKREDIKSIDKIFDIIKHKIEEWKENIAINIDEDNSHLTSSWSYEYTIFELVYLLKTIDWEKDTILFYGY